MSADQTPIAKSVRGGDTSLVATDSYPFAQHTVNQLADAGFPVQHVGIVGRDLHSIEQVTGRRGLRRATVVGAASGAWFGVLLGLLLGLLSPHLFLAVLIAAVAFAALWGAFFGFVRHWHTRGRRDFTSDKHVTASRYEVLVSAAHARRAADLLVRQPAGCRAAA